MDSAALLSCHSLLSVALMRVLRMHELYCVNVPIMCTPGSHLGWGTGTMLLYSIACCCHNDVFDASR
jgi:hypothetical protein